MEHTELLNYITHLPLDLPGSLFHDKPKNSGTARVSAASVNHFAEDVPDQIQKDILNSTLFAQRAANAKYPGDQSGSKEWYNFYTDILSKLGWNILNFRRDQVDNASASGTCSELVLSLLMGFLSPNEVDLFKDVLEGLKNAKSATKIFESSANNDKSANFQCGSIRMNGNFAEMKLGVYTFSTTAHIQNVLFWSWKDQTVNFYAGTATLLFNESMYAKVREAIMDRLGNNMLDFIDNVPLS
ncbi:Peptidase C14, caspase catalytic subunit p20 [Mycena indigotica]|uniref:Peptidase C14, caspase catalytic subunit p20 n=1 Tax=Mycena indigotica TaxID=2126181 RepID=A0A8H6SK52_9AGAR|nr:Peptidase C14, caspase catalytic subunit p20 [Mycena indigotica]KAF7301108.1 Peptidase C14, caspase catalytic subunit p20 [Mycena indigotica]